MAMIDQQDLRTHATHLASDELGGRYTGTVGQKMAADYIAAHFEKLGLLPLGDKVRGGKRSYFQEYPLQRTHLAPKFTAIKLGDETVAAGFAVVPSKKDSKGSKVRVKGVLAFCGNGSPDEIPKGSLKKHIPVVVLDEGRPGLRGAGMRAMQRSNAILRELKKRGARVAVFCLLSEESRLADAMNRSALLPGKPMLEFGNQRARIEGVFRPQDVPAVFAGRPLARRLLERLGIEVDPEGGFRQHETQEEPTAEVALQVVIDKKFSAVNVVAYRQGSHARLGKEAVVFSAHMDHMGTRVDGDAFNGADDNASGTAGLLEIAEAMASGEATKRSVVFLAVSGEELGLWGSEYFCAHPTWPLKSIVADINTDMIGRATELSGESEISVTPSFRHNEYSTLGRNAALLGHELGVGLTVGDRYYTRSDHYNFAKRGVPVVFFCDGEHEDYHKVTDHADKLDFAKMERVARLAYWTGWQAAETAAKPKRIGRQKQW